MLKICTHTATFIGLLGMIIGIMGEPTVLLAGTILVSAGLLAASIQSLKDK